MKIGVKYRKRSYHNNTIIPVDIGDSLVTVYRSDGVRLVTDRRWAEADYEQHTVPLQYLLVIGRISAEDGNCEESSALIDTEV